MANKDSSEKSKESEIRFKDSHGTAFHAIFQGLSRFSVSFEISGTFCSLRISEALNDFVIVLKGREAYSGRATVRQIVQTGTSHLCEVSLQENAWKAFDRALDLLAEGHFRREFAEFLAEWEKICRVRTDYKVIVSDMQSFFLDLRMWLDQVQLEVKDSKDSQKLECSITDQIAPHVLHCMDVLFERFENIAMGIPADLQAVHRSYMRRLLHPLVLAAPFAHRTFFKPLGYAGDYEMVNMIARNRHEGETIYAKVLNTWFLKQPPSQAHRNRIEYLKTHLINEVLRLKRLGRSARILNIGCGPALEIQDFLQDAICSDDAEFTLLDFNEETIAYASSVLSALSSKLNRRTRMQFQRKSIHHILKESVRPKPVSGPLYDLVYCAGLFDYLSDRTCQQLTDIFYSWTAPGGMVIVTNVEPQNPMRHGMEHLLDWNLIYRSASDMVKIRPALAAQDDVKIFSDMTGVNVFMEARKYNHA